MAQTVSNPFILRVKAATAVPEYVQLVDSEPDAPTWLYANRQLPVNWTRPGGDYRDSAETRNGPAHYATASIPTFGERVLTFNVTALVARLLQRNTGIYLSVSSGSGPSPIFAAREGTAKPGPSLLINTTAGKFDCPCIADAWVNPTAGLGMGAETTWGLPAMLKFDLSRVTGSLQNATLSVYVIDVFSGTTFPLGIAANYLDMPRLIHDPANELGGVQQGLASLMGQDNQLGAHPSVLYYADFPNLAAVQAQWQALGNFGVLGLGGQTFVSWPEFGVNAARVASRTDDPGITAMHAWASPKSTPPQPWQRDFGSGYDEMYFRYLLMIDPDVKLGMTESGVKLPGFSGSFEWNNTPRVNEGGWSARTLHGPVSPAHPDLYRFMAAQWYGHDWPLSQHSGQGKARWCNLANVCLRAGRKYSIEQYLKLNTQSGGEWNSDGILRLWIDGVLVHEETNIAVRADANAQIQSAPHVNIYHGGLRPPRAPIHYEIAGFVAATQYIGPPKRIA